MWALFCGMYLHTEIFKGDLIEKFSQISEMCFPDENYNYEAMAKNSTFIGAYAGEKCIGLAIMQEAYFKYISL